MVQTQELQDWAIDNEEVLIACYFDVEFDLYDEYEPHSGCITKKDMLELESDFYWDELPEQFITDIYDSTGKRCDQCFTLLSAEGYKTDYEARNFWGETCYEEILVGYKCSFCGNEESF